MLARTRVLASTIPGYQDELRLGWCNALRIEATHLIVSRAYGFDPSPAVLLYRKPLHAVIDPAQHGLVPLDRLEHPQACKNMLGISSA